MPKKNTTKIKTEKKTIEVYENEIFFFLDEYIADRDIDMHKEPQSRWNACLLYINKNVFTNKHDLRNDNIYNISGIYNTNNNSKLNNSNCNSYDLDKVSYILDLYLGLCYEYDKEVSIMGFCKLTGIDHETVKYWKSLENKENRNDLEQKRLTIYKKLHFEREESLSNIIVSGLRNPVGAIAVLNNKFGWSDNRTIVREERKVIAPVDREAIMSEFGNMIEENGTQDIVLDID